MRSEIFRWDHKVFDISRLTGDLNQELLRPQQIELSVSFIATYCQLFLDVDQASGRPRPPLAVNIEYIANISPERLFVPVIILYVGPCEGLISLCEDKPEPHYVVADGNHRLLSARRLKQSLSAYVLSPVESALYMTEIGQPED